MSEKGNLIPCRTTRTSYGPQRAGDKACRRWPPASVRWFHPDAIPKYAERIETKEAAKEEPKTTRPKGAQALSEMQGKVADRPEGASPPRGGGRGKGRR